MKKRTGIIILLLIILLTGCSQSAMTDQVAPDYAGVPEAPSVDAPDSYEKRYDFIVNETGSDGVDIVDKIIKRAQMSIEVPEMDAVLAQLAQVVQTNGGFIENSSKNAYDQSTRSYATIRIPVANFAIVYDAIKTYGEVTSEEVSTVDVTEEYFDLDTRLSVLTAKQESFAKLLEKAESIEDILRVENELNNVILDIESIKGHMKYLDRQVDMSTINLSLIEYNPVAVVEKNFGDRVKFAIKDGWGSMVNFAMDLAVGLIWLAPFLPLIVLALWLLRKLWRFVRAKRRAKREKIS